MCGMYLRCKNTRSSIWWNRQMDTISIEENDQIYNYEYQVDIKHK